MGLVGQPSASAGRVGPAAKVRDTPRLATLHRFAEEHFALDLSTGMSNASSTAPTTLRVSTVARTKHLDDEVRPPIDGGREILGAAHGHDREITPEGGICCAIPPYAGYWF